MFSSVIGKVRSICRNNYLAKLDHLIISVNLQLAIKLVSARNNCILAYINKSFVLKVLKIPLPHYIVGRSSSSSVYNHAKEVDIYSLRRLTVNYQLKINRATANGIGNIHGVRPIVVTVD